MKLVARIGCTFEKEYDDVGMVIGEWQWHTYDSRDFPCYWHWNRNHIKCVISLCAMKGHLHVLRYLVNHVCCDKSRFHNAIYFACNHNHINVVKYLIHEHDADAKNQYALFCAISNGCYDFVRYLVENGANVNAMSGEPLQLAVHHGHYDIIRYLVSNGASTDAPNEPIKYISQWK